MKEYGKYSHQGQNVISINIKKLHPNAVLPKYAHGPDEDAGMDLYAVEPAILEPMVPTLVKTGLSIELPAGYEAQIRPRSGLALKSGVTVWNSPGTIDPSYRGEIGVILLWAGTRGEYFKVNPLDRVAQLVISSYARVRWNLQQVLQDSLRGSDGFGSTGVGE